MRSNRNSRGSSLPLSIFTGIVILGIILLVIIFSSQILFETSSNATNNAQCLTLLSNLDRYSSTSDISRIKALFDKACAPLNVTITNEERFVDELKKCNSKAQKLIEQEQFLSRNSNVCIPCSALTSRIDFTINTNELKDDFQKDKFSKIEQKELIISSNSEQKTLLFNIENKKINFIVEEDVEVKYCNTFLNS